MWIRAFCCLLLLLSLPSFAQNVTLNYQKAPIQTVIGAMYGNILRKPYVLAPDLVATSKVVSLNVNISVDKLATFISGLLTDQGVYVVERDGVSYLSLSGKPPALVSAPPSASDVPASPHVVDTHSPQLSHANNDRDASETDDEPPSFVRYVPRYRKPTALCDAVGKVFGPLSCLPGDGTVHLVHAKFIKAVQAFCESLDTATPTVDLQLTFVEVSGNRRDGFGLSLVSSVLGATVSSSIGSPSADASVLTIKGLSFSAVLDALRSDSRFKQVASPSGLVDSGQPFHINIGDEVPTLAGQSRDQTGQVTDQVVYRPSGVILNVTPFVVGADPAKALVSASVDAQVSSFMVTTTGVNGSPTLSKRQIQTALTFAPGDVVVLGGLASSSGSSSKGSLFGVPMGWRDLSSDSELVLVMSARVAAVQRIGERP